MDDRGKVAKFSVADLKGCYGTELLFDLADGGGISVAIETFVEGSMNTVRLLVESDGGELLLTLDSDSVHGVKDLYFVGDEFLKIHRVATELEGLYDLSDLREGENPRIRFKEPGASSKKDVE